MAGKNTSVFGIYPTKGALESAVDRLQAAGFRGTDISVLFPENIGTKDFASYIAKIRQSVANDPDTIARVARRGVEPPSYVPWVMRGGRHSAAFDQL